MHLNSKILIHRNPEHVWAYLGNHANVPVWDRGVVRTRPNPDTAPGVGFEFETFRDPAGSGSEADRGRMSYRVTRTDLVEGCVVQLTSSDGNARYFKEAEWRFRVDPAPEGAVVMCSAHFRLRFRYLFLGPVLFVMRHAIHQDLVSLKRALENG
jgi:hypothetical protein